MSALEPELRITCVVPFCRRTRHTKDGVREWICGNHWPLVPSRLRKRKARLFRLYRHRYGDSHYGAYLAGSPQRLGAVKLDRLCGKAWEACKKAAIEAALGIS